MGDRIQAMGGRKLFFSASASPAPRHTGSTPAPWEAKRWITDRTPPRGEGGQGRGRPCSGCARPWPWQPWPWRPWRGWDPSPRGRLRRAWDNHGKGSGTSRSNPIAVATPRRWWPACGNNAIRRTPPWRSRWEHRRSWSAGAQAAGRCAARRRRRPGGAPSTRSCGSVVRIN